MRVGREAQGTYGEKWNGVQTGVLHHRHHFGVLSAKISPYVVPGDPKSGLLPRVSAAPPGEYGQADKRIQAYCYRLCLTDHPDNRLPFPKPDGYDPRQYELLLRVFEAGWRETFQKFDPIPNRKTDTNNHGPFSTDNIGFSYDYPEASYERRREILQEHETYQKGWLYFIANDPRVPKDVQDEMRRWGLAKDEFTKSGGWPHQIYVREARRMLGTFVMTEQELLKAAADAGPGRHGLVHHRLTQRAALRDAGRQRSERGRHRRVDQRPLFDCLRRAGAEARPGRQPAGAGRGLELAHRVRLDQDGAGVHGARPVGGDRRSARHRRRHGGAGRAVRATQGTVTEGRAGVGRETGGRETGGRSSARRRSRSTEHGTKSQTDESEHELRFQMVRTSL